MEEYEMNGNTRFAIAIVAIATIALSGAIPAVASDYTLGVFGNANEDDTVNMQDVTYIELIILEYRDQTELADAKYDGKINMQDVTQIELIILGKEKEMTILDHMGRIVTIKKPVERVVIGDQNTTLAFLDLMYWDAVAGRTQGVELEKEYVHGNYDSLPVCCSSEYEVYPEVIRKLKPDLFVVSSEITREQLDNVFNGLVYAMPENTPSLVCLNFTFEVNEDLVQIGDEPPMKVSENPLLSYIMNDVT